MKLNIAGESSFEHIFRRFTDRSLPLVLALLYKLNDFPDRRMAYIFGSAAIVAFVVMEKFKYGKGLKGFEALVERLIAQMNAASAAGTAIGSVRTLEMREPAVVETGDPGAVRLRDGGSGSGSRCANAGRLK